MNTALFLLITVVAEGIFIVTDFEEIHDDKVMGCAVSLENDGTRTTAANVSITLRRTWYSGKCYVKLSIPSHKNDKNYSILVLNTVVDVTKLFNGIIANPYVKPILRSFLETIDFEPKFPLTPGIYRATNLTIDEHLMPFIPNVKAFAEVRMVGKVSGFKKNMIVHHLKIYFEKR